MYPTGKTPPQGPYYHPQAEEITHSHPRFFLHLAERGREGGNYRSFTTGAFLDSNKVKHRFLVSQFLSVQQI